jgi:hypothetical protein
MSNSRLPRVRPIPDDIFNQNDKERREWAKSFLKEFVRPGESKEEQEEQD